VTHELLKERDLYSKLKYQNYTPIAGGGGISKIGIKLYIYIYIQ